MRRLLTRVVLVFLVATFLVSLIACRTPAESNPAPQTSSEDESWQETFNLDERELSSTGESTYFVLQPGFQTQLASANSTLVITVLDETRDVNGINTRVVEEREEINGELYEISRNFFAIDQSTGDVFYFGEEVDFYENGEVVRHSGEWLAYEGQNRPGLIMPGTPEVGLKYYQEIAPGAALDRAEVVSVSETYDTPAGEFAECLVTRETTPLEPNVVETKTYAPGIGMIQDETLELVSYGYIDE